MFQRKKLELVSNVQNLVPCEGKMGLELSYLTRPSARAFQFRLRWWAGVSLALLRKNIIRLRRICCISFEEVGLLWSLSCLTLRACKYTELHGWLNVVNFVCLISSEN